MPDLQPPAATPVSPTTLASRSAGRKLDVQTQESMSQTVAEDFSDVRIHTDALAGALTSAVSARAMATPAQAAAQFMRGTAAPVHAQLGRGAYRHIRQRHGPGQAPAGASEFNRATFDDLTLTVRRCVSRGRRSRNTGGRPGYVYVRQFDYDVGWDSQGRRTAWLKVVVNHGNVITAYPI